MLPLKLVLDTNIIISALLRPDGLQRAVLNFALTPPCKMYISEKTLKEYEGALKRPRFKLPPLEISGAIKLIRAKAEQVFPKAAITATADPDDNIFLECAEACRADYLVAGNKKHFPEFWKNTKIISPRELTNITALHLNPDD
jgi:putative PIN family toxin of toxin-antitoxin system